jgi:hypothetical protein
MEEERSKQRMTRPRVWEHYPLFLEQGVPEGERDFFDFSLQSHTSCETAFSDVNASSKSGFVVPDRQVKGG